MTFIVVTFIVTFIIVSLVAMVYQSVNKLIDKLIKKRPATSANVTSHKINKSIHTITQCVSDVNTTKITTHPVYQAKDRKESRQNARTTKHNAKNSEFKKILCNAEKLQKSCQVCK